MSEIATHPYAPKGSSLERVISAMGAVYDQIEADEFAFLAKAETTGVPLRCPPGCGECCKPFVPDILPVEAAYAAAWILQHKPGLAPEITGWKGRPAEPPCPLLERTAGGVRCSIYPGRFLICRLFCAAGMRDKDGRTSFRPCVHMRVSRFEDAGRIPLAGQELYRVYGAEPPVMADYATQVVGLAPSESGEARSVYEALPLAIVRVGLCLSLAAETAGRAASLAAPAVHGTYSNADEREEMPTG